MYIFTSKYNIYINKGKDTIFLNEQKFPIRKNLKISEISNIYTVLKNLFLFLD